MLLPKDLQEQMKNYTPEKRQREEHDLSLDELEQHFQRKIGDLKVNVIRPELSRCTSFQSASKATSKDGKVSSFLKNVESVL